jgi:hypothetical protein
MTSSCLRTHRSCSRCVERVGGQLVFMSRSPPRGVAVESHVAVERALTAKARAHAGRYRRYSVRGLVFTSSRTQARLLSRPGRADKAPTPERDATRIDRIRCALMALLIPGNAVLRAWRAFSEARLWAGLGDTEWEAFAADLGESGRDSLVVVAALPPAAFRAAFARKVGTPVAQAKLALAVNAVRARFGLPSAELFSEALAEGTAPGATPVPV